MTVRVFGNEVEFVRFLLMLPMPDGGVICTTYLPSALFSKTAISTFFTERQKLPGEEDVVQQLWTYGKRLIRYLSSGSCRLVVDEVSLAAFVNDGRVHSAVPQYEVSHHARVEALRRLIQLAAQTSVTVTPGPLPFVYRLVPPIGVLIDVADNTVHQLVQGIWLEDEAAYRQFRLEAERLSVIEGSMTGEELVARLDRAIGRLSAGRLPFWA